MVQQPVVVGGTYNWFLNASINTEAAPTVYGAWNLTGATVTVSFLYYGSGTTPTAAYHYTATIVTAASGTCRYINAASLFNTAGTWGVSWKVSLSGTVLESDIIKFKVSDSGAAQ